jgi:hypothetical protein
MPSSSRQSDDLLILNRTHDREESGTSAEAFEVSGGNIPDRERSHRTYAEAKEVAERYAHHARVDVWYEPSPDRDEMLLVASFRDADDA